MFRLLLEKKFYIILTAVIFGVIFASYTFIANYNKLTMSLSLNYPSAEKGLNPDGTRFNIFEIKSTEVLDKALADSEISGITVDDLGDRIDVYEKAPSGTTAKVLELNKSGKDYKYIPNEYTISYSQKNKFRTNHTYEMLSAIAKSYKEIFEQKHTEKNYVLKVDSAEFDDFNHYEYVEIADFLNNKLDAMEQYINDRYKENPTFTSGETNQNFTNLLSIIQNLKSIEVEKYKAFIVSSGLTKDRDMYVKKLYYTLNNLALERQKKISETGFIKGAIGVYDPNITGVAFIPSLDKNNEFYMNRTKTGLDYLTDSAYQSGYDTETISKDMDYYTFLINTFAAAPSDPVESARLVVAANDMLDKIENQLLEISKTATLTDNEYMIYKTKDYIKFNVPHNTLLGSIPIKRSITYAIYGFLLACIYFILKDRLMKKIRENDGTMPFKLR